MVVLKNSVKNLLPGSSISHFFEGAQKASIHTRKNLRDSRRSYRARVNSIVPTGTGHCGVRGPLAGPHRGPLCTTKQNTIPAGRCKWPSLILEHRLFGERWSSSVSSSSSPFFFLGVESSARIWEQEHPSVSAPWETRGQQQRHNTSAGVYLTFRHKSLC